MTQAQLESIFRQWQVRVNLGHWWIQTFYNVDLPGEAHASSTPTASYERGYVKFGPDAGEWSIEYANLICVHELVHFLTKGMDDAAHAAIAQIDSRSMEESSEEWYMYELEAAVDRYARLLIQLGGLCYPTSGTEPETGETPSV